jgi:hypothetical protein
MRVSFKMFRFDAVERGIGDHTSTVALKECLVASRRPVELLSALPTTRMVSLGEYAEVRGALILSTVASVACAKMAEKEWYCRSVLSWVTESAPEKPAAFKSVSHCSQDCVGLKNRPSS